MAQRPFPLPVQADKRVSQVSQISDFSVNSNGSDARRHKAHIGPWKLGRTLGRGSSGRVRLAKHAVTGKLAAIKIVPKLSATTIQKDRKGRPQGRVGGLPYGIEREVVIMKLIEHPNIMRLYDVWENKGELYLVLEYIEGGELFDYLVSRRSLPEHEAVDYIQQILNAVDYCHRFNICHRDLKPENLLLDRNKKMVKVADFGMAALEASGQMLQTSCGSPHYASPEIVAGKNYHGGPSDIWSCGIILFALLTGSLPFDDENVHVVLNKVKKGFFKMPSALSAEAKDLLWCMLEVDPLKRIKMDDILRHPLMLKYRRTRGPRLPRAPTYQELGRPVNSADEIDREILRNLQTLWRGAPKEVIVQKLLAPEQNSEKTFYLLLLKYRHERLENYGGDDEARLRMPKSSSRRSLKSVQSKKSSSSRRGHQKSASRGSKMSATSSHRRGVSFGAGGAGGVGGGKKKMRAELAPAIPVVGELAPPMEREVINYALPRRDSPPKRLPPVSPVRQSIEDESTRKMSAEFSQFLDLAFKTSTSPTSVLEDPETYQAKALPKIPFEAFLAPRPNSTEPSASVKVEQKQRAHKSAEVALPLPRIFEEERERFADAEEAAALAAAQENRDRVDRPKVIKGYSYPARPRAALGELDSNSAQQTNSASSAAAAAMRNFPSRRPPPESEAQRSSSLVEPKAPKAQSAGRRFFSAPTPGNATAPADQGEPAVAKRSWFVRKMSVLRPERNAPPPPLPAVRVPVIDQRSPPGHPVSNTANLAARRAAPPPPRLEEAAADDDDDDDDGYSPPRFPHPSTFSPSPVAVKQSFFARILGVKPANRVFHTTYNPAKLQREIGEALRRWERNDLGIKSIEDDRRTRTIRARLANRNALGLKAVRFKVEIRDAENGSQAIFSLEKGANSSFNRVADEYEQMLRSSNVLVDIRAPSRLSAYAL